MFKKILTDKSTIFSATAVLALATVGSKVLGVVRERIFASKFGAGDLMDAYLAAFRIPDLIFNLLILGALSSAFIPIFTELVAKKESKKAFEVANSFLNLTLLFVLAASVIIFIFAQPFVTLIVPRFSPEKQVLVANLTRIMIFSSVFLTISSVISGVLNSFKRFIAYSLAPIFYNVGIIIGALFLVDRYGIYGLAAGVVMGAVLHLLVQIPSVIMVRFSWRLIIRLSDELKRIGRLMLPRTVSLGVSQINLLVITTIASLLSAGSLSIFNYASNLQSFPVSVVGISFAVACFPFLAEAASKNNPREFRIHFAGTFSKITFFIIPISVLFIILRAQLVRLILGAGNFDWEDTWYTAQAMGLFSLSLFAQALLPLIIRAFYSLHDTKTPLWAGIVSMLTNIVLSYFLSKPWEVLGLALAFSISSFIELILLLIILRRRVGDLDDLRIIRNSFKIIVISLVVGFCSYFSLRIVGPMVDTQRYVGLFLQTLVAASAGGLIYFGLAVLFRCEEAVALVNRLKNYYARKN